MASRTLRGGCTALLLLTSSVGVAAQEAEPNSGTDPTRLISSAAAVWEHNDLASGFTRDSLRFDLAKPFGEKANYNLRLRVPFVRTDFTAGNTLRLGDVALQGTHVFGLTRQRGMVVQAEWIANTARRPDLGTGRDVFKGTFIYARFLPSGILAPALVHSADIGGDRGRNEVNVTTFDLYFVPTLADPKTFVTLDPAITYDWETNKGFASFAATVGRNLGPAFGGQSQIFVKPTLLGGGNRPADWSIEVGFKVLGLW